MVSLAAACDDGEADPAGDSTVVSVTTTSTAAAETSAVSTEPTTTTTSAPTTIAPTTVPPPTTSPEDALKAQIAADYLAADAARYDLVHAPTLDQLEARVALVAAPGSAFFDLMVARVENLVAIGDIVTANDPDSTRWSGSCRRRCRSSLPPTATSTGSPTCRTTPTSGSRRLRGSGRR
jgi:hypothetical protein